jgi:glutamine synthetase
MASENNLKDPANKFVTVAMVDTNGGLRGQMVSANSFEGILKNGMGMAPAQLALDPTDEALEMPSVTDGASADFHDEMLVVDPASARKLPWSKPGYDMLVLSQFAGNSAAICPRSILTATLTKAKAAGLNLRYGLELEYTLFDETAETAKAKGYRNLKTATLHKSHDLLLYQVVQLEWYEAVAEMCEPLGIKLAKMHEEIGGGFMEVCVAAGEGLGPSDQLTLLKTFIRALAMRQGKSVTYMARWNEDADSQSIHVHVSLKDKEGKPVFYDANARNNMSQTFLHFIGGLQKYLGDLTLMFLPTVNSYRRFAPGTFAPPHLGWGFENRSTAFRVVGHDAASLRIENRLPGADTNPYLTVAATLAAGLAGIQEKLEPWPEVIGNGYEQQGVAPDFPRHMPEAIERFRKSSFAHQTFGDRFIDAFSATRQSQFDAFSKKVPDVELQRYFDLG